MTDIPTDRQTDHATESVAAGQLKESSNRNRPVYVGEPHVLRLVTKRGMNDCEMSASQRTRYSPVTCNLVSCDPTFIVLSALHSAMNLLILSN